MVLLLDNRRLYLGSQILGTLVIPSIIEKKIRDVLMTVEEVSKYNEIDTGHGVNLIKKGKLKEMWYILVSINPVQEIHQSLEVRSR